MIIEDKLNSFLSENKFNDEAWQEKGLIPAPRATVDLMVETIKRITDEAKRAHLEGKSKNSIKKLLINNIENLQNEGQFDTEEQDFLTDLVCELASILDIKLEDPADNWFHPNEAIDRVEQKCNHCGFKLITWIQSKTKQINYWSWDIVECNKCGGVNLLSLDPHTQKCVGHGYEFVKQLNKNKYDQEAALEILNKMKGKTGR
uniref:DUF4844 domain-containing protein n=1 Tax=Roseihalotalea indica TaxID=2867963 RepID=A0AA49GPI1_9BACT|nr:DUF4844 domain-containing protein [Tunicatimonas sp. TK19036]